MTSRNPRPRRVFATVARPMSESCMASNALRVRGSESSSTYISTGILSHEIVEILSPGETSMPVGTVNGLGAPRITIEAEEQIWDRAEPSEDDPGARRIFRTPRAYR